jgi:hypothetical protein
VIVVGAMALVIWVAGARWARPGRRGS